MKPLKKFAENIFYSPIDIIAHPSGNITLYQGNLAEMKKLVAQDRPKGALVPRIPILFDPHETGNAAGNSYTRHD